MIDKEPAHHADPLRRAIHRARAELRERLDSEAGRRQLELMQLSERMRRRGAEIAERRLARETQRLDVDSSGSQPEPGGLDAEIGAVRTKLLARVRSTIDGVIAELATKAATQREQLAGRLEAGIAEAERRLQDSSAMGSRPPANGTIAEEIAVQIEELEQQVVLRREQELRENREALGAVREQLAAEIAAEIQRLRRDASETIDARLAIADRRLELVEERIRDHVEHLQAQLTGARPAPVPAPQAAGSGQGPEEESIRSAADRAERRLVETARIAEATVAARAEAATAAALCEITARAVAVAKSLERHERRLEAEVRFDDIAEQMTTADRRRRSGDLRTRTALSELRV